MYEKDDFVLAESLGITEMYFLQQPGLPDDALGRITLGPLECVETSMRIVLALFINRRSFFNSFLPRDVYSTTTVQKFIIIKAQLKS